METIEHKGVTYVKATVLAKKHHYTTDYIGQLCRSGKVEARLVGRAWFVDEDTLTNHKSERYSDTRSPEIIINKSTFSDMAVHPVALRREIRPVLSKTTHRSIVQQNPGITYNFESRNGAQITTYHEDTSQLEPAMQQSERKPKFSQQDITDLSRKIKVSLEEKPSSKLVFEELPEVTLNGTLKVASLDEAVFFAEVEPVSPQDLSFNTESVAKSPVVVTKRYQPQTTIRYVSSPKVTMPAETLLEPAVEKQSRVSSVGQFESKIMSASSLEKKPISFMVIPMFVICSAAATVVFLGLVSSVETDGLSFNKSLSFTPAAVIDSLERLSNSY